jgi:hypothetical protein
MVRFLCTAYATFPAPLGSHYRLPLNPPLTIKKPRATSTLLLMLSSIAQHKPLRYRKEVCFRRKLRHENYFLPYTIFCFVFSFHLIHFCCGSKQTGFWQKFLLLFAQFALDQNGVETEMPIFLICSLIVDEKQPRSGWRISNSDCQCLHRNSPGFKSQHPPIQKCWNST